MPSITEAWWSSSEMTASAGPSSVSNRPAFASKHELYRIVASVDRNSDSLPSSSLCGSCGPQVNRTAAIPKPHRRKASRAGPVLRGADPPLRLDQPGCPDLVQLGAQVVANGAVHQAVLPLTRSS